MSVWRISSRSTAGRTRRDQRKPKLRRKSWAESCPHRFHDKKTKRLHLFITDYEVFAERPADCTLTGQVIERHEKPFGERPEVLAADKGFCPDAEKYAELEERVGTLARSAAGADCSDVAGSTQLYPSRPPATIAGNIRSNR